MVEFLHFSIFLFRQRNITSYSLIGSPCKTIVMNGWKAINGINRMAMDFGATAIGFDGFAMFG